MEPSSSNYRFYKKPRFSANHIADYLCTLDAPQREAVIRRAKFPRKPNTIAYQQVVPAIRGFLTSGKGDLSFFDGLIVRLNAKAGKEEGYNRDEALRCLNAVDAFKSTFSSTKLNKITFGPGPKDVVFKVSEVTINLHLDPPIVEKAKDGSVYSGGCIVHLANSPEARKNIEERTKIVAAITHWGLERASSNIEPLPRLCMSFDVFGRNVVKAPAAFGVLRKKVEASCREVADGWDRIEPPAGYDGPPWR